VHLAKAALLADSKVSALNHAEKGEKDEPDLDEGE
jgi:hypothetical protein